MSDSPVSLRKSDFPPFSDLSYSDLSVDRARLGAVPFKDGSAPMWITDRYFHIELNWCVMHQAGPLVCLHRLSDSQRPTVLPGMRSVS